MHEDISPVELAQRGPVAAAWYGQEPLWLAYWVYGVIGGNLSGFAVEASFDHVPLAAGLAIVAAALAYQVWANVAIWRCARNSTFFWGALARGTVVLAVLYFCWAFGSNFFGGT